MEVGTYPTLTPPKTNMEAKNWWFVDVFPFAKRVFSGSSRSFSEV